MRTMIALKCTLATCGLTCLVWLLISTVPADAEGVNKPVLSDGDCIKCHSGPPADIAKAGGMHKEVPCTGCHEGHRPSSPNNIPKCSECHVSEPHFELTGCLNCHRNPHQPKNIILPGSLTKPCLTCHTRQNEQLQANKSMHTEQFCSDCHDVHGKKPSCLECHDSHSQDLGADDCRLCHQAHMPKKVTYPSDIPNLACAACHRGAYDKLTASQTKHNSKRCAYCHKKEHKTVPACQDCHGTPHAEGIMAKFPKCGDCHSVAHDLNNWQAGKK